MRLPRPTELSLSTLALLPSLTSAASSVDCSDIRVNDVPYDLSQLGGAHTVYWLEPGHPVERNHTFTLDICAPLKKEKNDDEGKVKECKSGANICEIEYHGTGDDRRIDLVKSIAGNFATSHGKTQDARWTRLKDSDSNEDSDKDGLRLELNGGQFPMSGSGSKTEQKALIEFICDAERTGLEGAGVVDQHFKAPPPKKEEKERRAPADGDGDDGDDDDDDGDDEDGDGKTDPEDDARSLQFKSYKLESPGKSEAEVLRLTWRTKYACENASADNPKKSAGSWGFFTWFIIVLFLGIATYLVFGSWLNYTRYGARGWDLLPHGDTIRDLPYLLRDGARRVMGAFQGSAGRGGYSAV